MDGETNPATQLRRRLYPALAATLVFALGGCATTYDLGQSALQDGRYAEAASRFELALAERPSRTDALVGLGIARYEQGAYNEAATHLAQALRQAPKNRDAQLYLALSYLRLGDENSAAEHLRAFRGLVQSARIVRQVDDALELIRVEPTLSPESRRFIAASLVSALKTEQDLQNARLYGDWRFTTDVNPFFADWTW